jgi:hypothetical protein
MQEGWFIMKMNRTVSALLILLLLHTALTAESYLRLELDNHRTENADTGKQKQTSGISKEYGDDLVMGYFMAIVPGFFVHGAGNMYADHWRTGLILSGVELVGIICFLAYAIPRAFNENNEGDETDKSILLLAVSNILFFGSYAWDIVTVGGAISERHPEGARISMGILPGNNENEHMLFGVRISF